MRRIAIINDTAAAGSGHFGCSTVMEVLERELDSRGCTATIRVPPSVNWRELESVLSQDVDAIIVNGEGTIHHTATRKRAAGLAEFGRFARDRLKKPAFLINATLFELAPESVAGIAAFNGVYVRDSASLQELDSLSGSAQVVPDLTLAFDFPPPQPRMGVCVTDSVLPEGKQKLKAISRAQGWPQIAIKPRPATGRVPEISTASDFARFIGSCEGVLTGRFHAVTFCIGTRTPYVALASNTPKIQSITTDVLGNSNRVMDLETLRARKAKPMLAWGPGELELVDAYARNARLRIEKMFDEICGAI